MNSRTTLAWLVGVGLFATSATARAQCCLEFQTQCVEYGYVPEGTGVLEG
jgi:hypothetical protein